MIVGAHTILFAQDANKVRAFLRDVLGRPHVDAGDGWLIFRSPPSEIAVHPAEAPAAGTHALYLICDDLEATIAELAAKDVDCAPVSEERWGRLTSISVPGGVTLGLYEPHHPLAVELAD